MKYITGGFSIFFLLVLLYLLFRLWLEGHRERIAPGGITGETLPAELREDALRPLRQLNIYIMKSEIRNRLTLISMKQCCRKSF